MTTTSTCGLAFWQSRADAAATERASCTDPDMRKYLLVVESNARSEVRALERPISPTLPLTRVLTLGEMAARFAAGRTDDATVSVAALAAE